MIYRATETAVIATAEGREVNITTGERIDSRFWLAEDLVILEARGMIFVDDEVEQATKSPGEKRATRRS